MNIKAAMQLSDEQFWLEVSRAITPGPWQLPKCPGPPTLKDLPEVLAFRLRDRVYETDLDSAHIALGRVAGPLCRLTRAAWWLDRYDWSRWYMGATPREQVTCCLAALGLWEVTR